MFRDDEEKVMGVKIQKVKSAISKVLEECVNELPEVQLGWRNVIENHFVNSRKYKGVEIQNNNTKKRISFYLA